MSVVTEKALEAAARCIALHVGCGDARDFRDCNRKTCDCRAAASDALAAVAPSIAAQERERCAVVADAERHNTAMLTSMPPQSAAAVKIAAAIRAIKETT